MKLENGMSGKDEEFSREHQICFGLRDQGGESFMSTALKHSTGGTGRRGRFAVLLPSLFHGADRVHRTSNNRRSHSTQCISRDFEILQAERKSRVAETDRETESRDRVLYTRTLFFRSVTNREAVERGRA